MKIWESQLVKDFKKKDVRIITKKKKPKISFEEVLDDKIKSNAGIAGIFFGIRSDNCN